MLKFRYFSSEVFEKMSERYISYYKDKGDTVSLDLPTYEVDYQDVEYNLYQYKLYHFL